MYIYTYNGDYDYYIIDINSYKFNYISSEEYIKSFDDILNNKINITPQNSSSLTSLKSSLILTCGDDMLVKMWDWDKDFELVRV